MKKTTNEQITEKRAEYEKQMKKTIRLREQLKFMERRKELEEREEFAKKYYGRKSEIELLLRSDA